MISFAKYSATFGCALFLFGCGNTPQNTYTRSVENVDSLRFDSICRLQENTSFIGKLSSIDMIDTSHFVIATQEPSSVIIYNTKGEQEQTIGREGRGPSEYLKASIVKSYNGRIYVWCAMSLKLLVYNDQGQPIAEYTGFNQAIQDFALYKNLICFYMSGGEEDLIKIYDIDKTTFIHSFGKSSNEHNILNLSAGAGAITVLGNELLYVSADQLTIHRINLNNFDTQDFDFQDKNFEVEPIKTNAVELINSDRNQVFKYINENSIVTNLFATAEYVILQAEIGRYTFDNEKADFSQRFTKFYLFSPELKFEYAVTIPFDPCSNNRLYTAYGNNVYNVSSRLVEDNLNITLWKMSFQH